VHSRAHVTTFASGEWTVVMGPTASGAQNQDLTTVAPFARVGASPGLMTGLLDDDSHLLFSGTTNRVLISGSNRRFLGTFVVPILPSGGGAAGPGGPMGLVVVLANGGSVFKFYNPGVLKGDGQWRRL
jgi:hypothetical protein